MLFKLYSVFFPRFLKAFRTFFAVLFPVTKTIEIPLFQAFFTLSIMYFSQQNLAFDVHTNSNHIPTKLRISGQYFYSTNTVRAAFSHKILVP